MKNIKIKLLFIPSLFVLMVTGACSSFLDKEPTNSATGDVVFNSLTGAEAAYNGAFYSLMEWFSRYAYPGYGSIKISIDVMGNDVVSFNRYGCPWEMYQFTHTNNKTSRITENFWNHYYASINNCNGIISNLSTEKEYDGHEVLGKAYFLRAFAYFDLVRLYQFTYASHKDASVCPIYTEPLTSPDHTKPLATVQEVYQQIVADLTRADSLLAKSQRDDKDMPNQSVVEGLLARVYLTMGQWDLAALYANKAKQAYPLMSGDQYRGGFNDLTNPEWMWCFVQLANQNDMSYVFYFLDNISTNAGGYSYYNNFRPDPNFRELFQDGDVRKDGLFGWDTSSGPGLGYMTYTKFRMPSSQYGDLILMRAAEMYLIEAEALARQNKLSAAEDVLAQLLDTRNASFPRGLTQVQLIDRILVERRKELWGEGFGLFDILRTEQTVSRVAIDPKDAKWSDFPFDPQRSSMEPRGHSILKFPNGNAFTVNSPYYLFAIPQSEVQNNPNIH